MTTYPSAEKSAAAKFVWSLIVNHGDITTMKIDERTANLYNLTQDITGKYAAQVELIDQEGIAHALKRINDEFIWR